MKIVFFRHPYQKQQDQYANHAWGNLHYLENHREKFTAGKQISGFKYDYITWIIDMKYWIRIYRHFFSIIMLFWYITRARGKCVTIIYSCMCLTFYLFYQRLHTTWLFCFSKNLWRHFFVNEFQACCWTCLFCFYLSVNFEF